ncbi:hypothetical protein AB0F91_03105 [Amycolatopsis sp. NPDC023774]|uniref:hypothetical protein n=1 Tax=Amycolatopsis sp. NPDC023774 TaxID=3155015 RepID=UPI0033EF7C1E
MTNRLGNLLTHASRLVTSGTGLLEAEAPNLTGYVFTGPRARAFFAGRAEVADERAFDLWLGPAVENGEWLTADLAPVTGPEFTSSVSSGVVPPRGVLRSNHPVGVRCGCAGRRWNSRRTGSSWSSS